MALISRRAVIEGTMAILSSTAILRSGYVLSAAAKSFVVISKRIALVIGNAKYEQVGCSRKHDCSLHSPVLDAKAVGATLKFLGYDVTELTNVGYANLRKSIAEFARKATVCDTAMLYYSGHGMQIENENYLIPVDAQFELLDESRLEDSCVLMGWAEDAVATAKSLGIVVLDACRDNPFMSYLRKSNITPKKKYKAGLAPVDPNNYFLVSYATAANKVAQDGKRNELSPYAKALITHLPTPELSIRDAFARVQTSVCDITSGASPDKTGDVEQKCQMPFLYDNLGAIPLFMTDQPDQPAVTSPFPVLTNVKMADPKDPAVDRLIGADNTQFAFRYIWTEPEAPGSQASILPDLDYFTSLQDRGQPLIVAEHTGFYAPDLSSGVWSLSFPLLDVIARKISPNDVKISEIIFEADRSRADLTPYVNMVIEEDQLATVTLVNEGWVDISSARLVFDVVGFKEGFDEDMIEATIRAKRDAPYLHTVNVQPFKEQRQISVIDVIRGDLPELPMFEFFSKHDVSYDDKQKLTIRKFDTQAKVMAPKGFKKWMRAHKDRLTVGYEDPPYYWIVGRLSATATDGQTSIADFAAGLVLVLPGVGAPSIDYDLIDFVKLPIDGKRHVIRKGIGKVLKKDNTTFRGLYPLVTGRSSFHDLRFSLKDSSGSDLYVSPWITVHIVVSRPSKKAVLDAIKLPY